LHGILRAPSALGLYSDPPDRAFRISAGASPSVGLQQNLRAMQTLWPDAIPVRRA
jgi:hypothetical protein